jgi:hypothetical protein
MAIPLVAICIAYLFHKVKWQGRLLILGLFVFQYALYGVGYAKVMTLEDGRVGLSSFIAKIPDAQNWFANNYDDGLVRQKKRLSFLMSHPECQVVQELPPLRMRLIYTVNRYQLVEELQWKSNKLLKITNSRKY